jgi:hypothetical protein
MGILSFLYVSRRLKCTVSGRQLYLPTIINEKRENVNRLSDNYAISAKYFSAEDDEGAAADGSKKYPRPRMIRRHGYNGLVSAEEFKTLHAFPRKISRGSS